LGWLDFWPVYIIEFCAQKSDRMKKLLKGHPSFIIEWRIGYKTNEKKSPGNRTGSNHATETGGVYSPGSARFIS
jgi:hypothetical protein